MEENWRDTVRKEMYLNEIKVNDIVAKTNWTRTYVSLVLNGRKNPKRGKFVIEKALEEVLKEKG